MGTLNPSIQEQFMRSSKQASVCMIRAGAATDKACAAHYNLAQEAGARAYETREGSEAKGTFRSKPSTPQPAVDWTIIGSRRRETANASEEGNDDSKEGRNVSEEGRDISEESRDDWWVLNARGVARPEDDPFHADWPHW